MLENLAESLDTAAEMLLEEQQSMGMHRLDCFLIYLSIVALTKMLASNRKFANQGHMLGQQQMIGDTNQFFSPSNK